MAVMRLGIGDDAFERAQALGRIARTLLAVRLTCCVMVDIWLSMGPASSVLLWGMFVASAWFLLLLLRWSTLGVAMCGHPAILAIDTALCFAALAASRPMSPMLLLVGTGALLTGLCLGRRGAVVFAPISVAAWWLVLVDGTNDFVGSADIFVALVLVPVLLVGLLAAGVGIRSASLDAAAAEELLRRQTRISGVAEERARLAREMHDSLVKSLHGIALMADALPGWVERSPERAAEQARTIAQLIKQTSRDSREVILAMRRARADSSPAEVVRGAVSRWRRSSGRSATLDVDGDPVLSTESCYELAALLNEALENVSRHTADGTPVTVELAERSGWVVLVVQDRGGGEPIGPDQFAMPGHFGVVGMRERAARVGGDLRIEAVPGTGVRVEARLPASLEADETAEPREAPSASSTASGSPGLRPGVGR